MRVKVTEKEVVISEYSTICEGDVKVNRCDFDLPDTFKELNVTASFNNIPLPIINGSCYIPTLKKGTATLGVYAYKDANGAVELMYSPKCAKFYVQEGSYCDDVEVERVPEISEFEKYCQELKKMSVLKSEILKSYNKETVVKPEDVYSASAVNEAIDSFKNYSSKEDVSNNIYGETRHNLSSIIKDISPLKHNIKVTVSGRLPQGGWDNAEIVKVGRNLFTVSNREKKIALQTESKNYYFNTKGIFMGYNPEKGETDESAGKIISIDKQNEQIKVILNSSEVGIGFDINVDVGSTYYFSIPENTGVSAVNIIELDSIGQFLNKERKSLNFSLKIKNGVSYVIFELLTNKVNTEITISNIMVTCDEAATPYEPYKRLQAFPIKYGTVVNIESEYPITRLFAYNPRILLKCQYNLDANLIYRKIKNAILSLGGNI